MKVQEFKLERFVLGFEILDPGAEREHDHDEDNGGPMKETRSRSIAEGHFGSKDGFAYGQNGSLTQLRHTCFVAVMQFPVSLFSHGSRSCNAYLFKGRERTVLVDPGLDSEFGSLASGLNEVGIAPDAIDMIVLTHEHFDHIAATPCFTGRPSVVAHVLTARKIANTDESTILRASFAGQALNFPADTILADGRLMDTGDHKIRVIWTPGHSSGCVCLLNNSACS